jgi:hypothetical protein
MRGRDERTRAITESEKLSRLAVGSPCEASWDGMAGDERRRHCAQCDQKVFDFERMAPREIAALIEASRGRLCGRITRTPEGRLVTLEPPAPVLPPSSWLTRRVSPTVAAVITALLGLSAVAADAPVQAPAETSAAPEPKAGPGCVHPQQGGGGEAFLSGRLIDAAGAPLAGAEVVARNTFDGHERATTSDLDGRFGFGGLEAGVYDVEGRLEGVAISPQRNLFVHPGERLQVGLQALSERVGFPLGGVIALQEAPLRQVF